jgi:hypothetical protein
MQWQSEREGVCSGTERGTEGGYSASEREGEDAVVVREGRCSGSERGTEGVCSGSERGREDAVAVREGGRIKWQ